FVPLVAACPGCGRTTSTTFQELARSIQDFIRDEMPGWKTQYPGVETLNVAVMGCIVNGPGESKHANIGISLPGTGEAPAAPVFGAEISGVDIGKLVSDESRSNRQMDEIHRALAENLVIFFRDQHISPEQHLAFGRKFGELHIHPAAPHEGDDPALMKIYADKDSPRANGEGCHTDVSCDLEPPMGSILYIKQCPPRGGDTLFANMYAAYEALSERMKTYLDG